MNKTGGFIAIHRQILDWEWYKNVNTKVLFIHLLLTANFKDSGFEGRKILRGQLVTSLASLSAELGLTVKQIRGSLEHLISTGEITSEAHTRYRIITIVRYNEYQSDDGQNGSQRADERAAKGQAEGRLRAGKGQAEGRQRATIEQCNKENNDNKVTKKQERDAAPRFSPPSLAEVTAYCQERHNKVIPEKWYDYYTSNGWMVGRNRMKDWRAAVRTWERRDDGSPQSRTKTVVAQQYSQRDYSESGMDILEALAMMGQGDTG